VRLGEVLKEPLKNGLNYRREDFGFGTKFVNVSDIFCPAIIDTKKLDRINLPLKDVEKYRLKTGDILIVRSSLKREGVAYPAIFVEDEEPVVFCGFLIRVRPDKKKTEPFYLLNYLRSSIARERLVGDSDTVTITNVDQGTLLSLNIPLPPLEEQKRIAAKIQELMQDVERARTACEKQLEAAKALPAAYLRGVFDSEKAKKLERKRLVECLNILESGSRPKGCVFEIKEGIPSIGAEHLNSFGGFYLNNSRFIPIEFYQTMKRGKVQKKDVLVVKDGATTGKVSIVGDAFPYEKAAINEHVFRLRGERSLLKQEFLFWFLYSTTGQSQIQQEFHGSAQGGINQKFVDGISIPIPDLHTQQRIASELKEKMARVENLRTGIEKQLKAITTLPQSILRKAFRGEL